MACTRGRCCPRSSRTRPETPQDRKSTRLNSSHLVTSYAVFCLKKKKQLIFKRSNTFPSDFLTSLRPLHHCSPLSARTAIRSPPPVRSALLRQSSQPHSARAPHR